MPPTASELCLEGLRPVLSLADPWTQTEMPVTSVAITRLLDEKPGRKTALPARPMIRRSDTTQDSNILVGVECARALTEQVHHSRRHTLCFRTAL